MADSRSTSMFLAGVITGAGILGAIWLLMSLRTPLPPNAAAPTSSTPIAQADPAPQPAPVPRGAATPKELPPETNKELMGVPVIDALHLQPVQLVVGDAPRSDLSGGWREIPDWLEGADIYSKTNGADPGGILDCTVEKGGVLYIACNWEYQGNPGGDWQATRWTLEEFKLHGWQEVPGKLVSNRGRNFIVLQKTVRRGDHLVMRCNKYEPPYMLFTPNLPTKSPATQAH